MYLSFQSKTSEKYFFFPVKIQFNLVMRLTGRRLRQHGFSDNRHILFIEEVLRDLTEKKQGSSHATHAHTHEHAPLVGSPSDASRNICSRNWTLNINSVSEKRKF